MKIGVLKLTFLGYQISAKRYKPAPSKVKAIAGYLKPENISDLRKFLEIINFYHSSVPHLAESEIPLNDFLKNAKKNDKSPVPWTLQSELAFEKCKRDPAHATLRSFPLKVAPIPLVTDASDLAVCASLEQDIDKVWKPLAFFSRKFNPAQTRHSTYN